MARKKIEVKPMTTATAEEQALKPVRVELTEEAPSDAA